MDYFKKWADRDTEELNRQKFGRQNYVNQIGDTVTDDGSRTIVQPENQKREDSEMLQVMHKMH
jgi:hypothetical protein